LNLFSINKALENGFNHSNVDLSLCLSHGLFSVTFDRVLRAANGFVSGIIRYVYNCHFVYNSIKSLVSSKITHINKLREIFGHCGMDRLQNTANIYAFKVNRNNVCQDCDVARDRKKISIRTER
jgi:hypothetical protein